MSDLRFPRTHRLRKSREFRSHRRRSRTFRTRHFLVSWAKGQAGHCRLGLAVSKKVGNSPQRNRVKRVLREWYRHHWKSLAKHWDLVLIARPGAAELGFHEATAELQEFIDWINRRNRREARRKGKR